MRAPSDRSSAEADLDQSSLAAAVSRGAVAKARKLVAKGANPFALFNGQSLPELLIGSGAESLETLDWLASLGCPIEQSDRRGRSLLCRAISRGHAAMALSLLARGFSHERRDESLKTALHLACAAKGGGALARALLEKGADPNARDRRGFTPLHYAAAMGDAALCQELAAAGSDVEARTVNGNTPLHKAAEAHRQEAVETLLALGASPLATNAKSETPLSRHVEFARLDPLCQKTDPKLRAAVCGCLDSAQTRVELEAIVERKRRTSPRSL